MQDIRTWWDASTSKMPGGSLELGSWEEFYETAKHNLQFFTFHPSTPSAVVSSGMQSAFFDCAIPEQPFLVVSNAGIKSALDVRMPDPVFSTFLKELPVFPKELLGGSKSMVTALRERGMLKNITFVDVLEELRKRPLSEEEMVACLRWWINASQRDPGGTNGIRREFIGAASLIFCSSDNGDERIIPLGGIRTFLNLQNLVVPTNGPLPSHLLPVSVSGKFDLAQLQKHLQWKEFTDLEWVQHIVDPAVYTQKSEFNIVESPAWADCVLQVLCGRWRNLLGANKITVIGLLSKLTCIPTTAGMKVPSEAYFSNADVFPGLPIVNLPSGVQIKDNLENVLADLGVRKHVDPQVILDR